MLAFAIGTTTHLRDVFANGWLPRPEVPLAVGVFWKVLTLLDPLVVLLLVLRRNAGLGLGLAVIVVDVIVNSYVEYRFDPPMFSWALQSQSLFLGFALGSVGFLWRRGPEQAP